MKAFISYSHKDEQALGRLHTHLAMLRRENLIDAWYDREILAGGDIDNDIAAQLKQSEVFIALVSPDFLASDYCYDKEMQRAIKRCKAGEIRIVPIIVEPCDWKSSPLNQFKALPKDGKPISNWDNENEAYLDIVEELRRIIKTKSESGNIIQTEEIPNSEPRKGNYRVRRDFDKIDRADFCSDAFSQISQFFEKSINELDKVNGLRARFYKANNSFTCTIINQKLERGNESHITVHKSSGSGALGDIYYSFQENTPKNTANGWMDIESDDYELFLSWNAFTHTNKEELLTPQQVAEALWKEFLGNAGISYD